ncbi:asparagine synthase (glutamine-hydrolyzing) [Clostridium uliginosum]|uniref:asparagine synthase (glutamine-hydrolyzing) n=1 Tax=Clostridium uliginosum TaxID=119641 RepID=A0A1I1R452_9CLOT|nr:asparagine synthase (glutamine-hydrolyzing) [Clostridium uliginosum]SFD26343.1 asparagine synthase (glutamine-hydrolysing) [Clostridium uliginosum]
MCSIAGIMDLNICPIENMQKKLEVMNNLQIHRGPDGFGVWKNENSSVGFAHRRLSIIDIDSGQQPMCDDGGNWICFNGEIYNYKELREEIGCKCKTNSDTEVILYAYRKWGEDCVSHFKGMFAFAIWDEKAGKLFCSRDRFGIKPFYYTINNNVFYFASEMKALLPFVKKIETDKEGLKDYLTFQMCLGGKTLFQDIKELEPAHNIIIKSGNVTIERYWQVYYNIDFDHTEKWFAERLEEAFLESVKYHTVSDVPIGGYVSGGVDSSIISAMASKVCDGEFVGFTGKFTISKDYDESEYAKIVAKNSNFDLYQLDITSQDFIDNIEKVIYHLDTPIAGPGSFSQYMISSLAAKHRKVVLGGQGGDEIFGGYTRYLVAYFEQCIKGAIDGTMNSGDFIVTYESIIPNLTSLYNYKPMLKEFWSNGLFDDPDKRYFSLINRAPKIKDCVNWNELGEYNPYESFRKIFMANNVNEKSYFDRMTHFDFKTLLPALLQVEDRMGMAHGLESRVPFLDHKLVELAATMPANVKFKEGNMKHILRKSMDKYVPNEVMNRKDKMGFPTPFNYWVKNDAKDFIYDIFTSEKAKSRRYIKNSEFINKINGESQFGRNMWGLLSLELWQRSFHDKEAYYKSLID